MMPTTVTKFFGFGAFVGAIKGLRQVEWWYRQPADLNWDTKLLIPTDLAKTPLALGAGTITSIQDIECDDHVGNGGRTQLGPRYPQGEMVGLVWLSEHYYNSLKAKGLQPPRHQTTDGHDHELTLLIHWDASGKKVDKRYYGFHADGITVGATDVDADVYLAGRGKIGGEKPKKVKFKKGEYDAAASAGSGTGALYILGDTARDLQLFGPKRPEAAGL